MDKNEDYQAGYGDGYADGKDKAHFEIRALMDHGGHDYGCECEPCLTILHVTTKLLVSMVQAFPVPQPPAVPE